MKLTAQEEYGLRCLLQVARRAPSDAAVPASIRDVAEAEGLSSDYAAKLLRVLRQSGMLDSERGAAGGYRLARSPEEIVLHDVLKALDAPLYSGEFCQTHAGQLGECVHHLSGCALKPVWGAVEDAIACVLGRLTVADVLAGEDSVRQRMSPADGRGAPAPRAPAQSTPDRPAVHDIAQGGRHG